MATGNHEIMFGISDSNEVNSSQCNDTLIPVVVVVTFKA